MGATLAALGILLWWLGIVAAAAVTGIWSGIWVYELLVQLATSGGDTLSGGAAIGCFILAFLAGWVMAGVGAGLYKIASVILLFLFGAIITCFS